jgi:hypothetical protein
MRGASFEDRLQRMTAGVRGGTPAQVAPALPLTPEFAAPERTALERYDDAIALVVRAGQTPSRSMLLRSLAQMGVPISPLCYWPPANLFLWGVMVLLIILGGTLSLTEWMFMALDADQMNPEWYAAFRFAYAGLIVLSSLMAAVFTWRQKLIAYRASLPDWSEV